MKCSALAEVNCRICNPCSLRGKKHIPVFVEQQAPFKAVYFLACSIYAAK